MAITFYTKEEVEQLVNEEVLKDRKKTADTMRNSLSIGATWAKNIDAWEKNWPYSLKL